MQLPVQLLTYQRPAIFDTGILKSHSLAQIRFSVFELVSPLFTTESPSHLVFEQVKPLIV